MLWQVTRAGVAVLGLFLIGDGLIEWGRAIADLLAVHPRDLGEPVTLEHADLWTSIRITWLSFAFPGSFGFLLVAFSGPITFLLVPPESERIQVQLPELLTLGVSLVGLFLLITGLSAASSSIATGLVWATQSEDLHLSRLFPFLAGNLMQIVVGLLVARNAERIARIV